LVCSYLRFFDEASSLPKIFMCDPAAEGPGAKSESELFVVRGNLL